MCLRPHIYIHFIRLVRLWTIITQNVENVCTNAAQIKITEVIFMLTSDLEEKLKSSETFDEEMVENNAHLKPVEVLSQYINEKKISKAEVIRMLNIDRNHGYQMLNGTRPLSRNILIKISIILKLDTEQINFLLRIAEKPQLYVKNFVDAKVFYAVKHHMEYLDAVEFIWGTSVIVQQ